MIDNVRKVLGYCYENIQSDRKENIHKTIQNVLANINRIFQDNKVFKNKTVNKIFVVQELWKRNKCYNSKKQL